MSFILASSSPRRLDLLKSVGIIPDQVISPDIDETPLKGEKPRDCALRLAQEKNIVAQEKHQGSIILTADTIVACGRFMLPKAETKEDFDLCMKKISGRRHRVYTAISICDAHNKRRSKVILSMVKVKRLTDTEKNIFFETKEWVGKSGGYAIQGYFSRYVESLSGSYSSIMGLPICQTVNMMISSGLKV